MKSPQRVFVGLLMLLAVGASLFSLNSDIPAAARNRPASMPRNEADLSDLLASDPPQLDEADRGPIVAQSVAASVWNGDLRDLPQRTDTYPRLEMPRPGMFKDWPLSSAGTADPLAQTWQGVGQMPDPLMNFDGLHYGEYGGWHPPDTEGDVGPNHYMEVVNIGIGIFDKATGARLVGTSFNDFFQGPPGSLCGSANAGDPVVNYDPIADRWIVSDFVLTGGSHQCVAVSQTGDPVSGGWYYYYFNTQDPDSSSWCDYPKIGVWPDAYYLTCNMFDPWIGANVFALDRAAMLSGAPVVTSVMFHTGSDYGSLLPSNLRGPLPPADSPNYMVASSFPDLLQIWEFHVDWATPGNSTFTGPVEMTVAPFGYIQSIPQRGTGQVVDSLGDRLMFFLQYRNLGDHEALFVNQTVPSGASAGVRWYEVRDPGGAPYVYQQGTFAPDDDYRWMGSIAADQDGNLALGYSVSSADLYPAIRYTGRLNGEALGQMTQGETSLIEGGGSQTGSNRWGDYSAMSVDPADDCTFWYTQEYFPTTGGAWYTRIGSFKFPSCGQPKGWVDGTVQDLVTGAPIAGAPVMAEGITMTFSAVTDANGHFTMTLTGGAYAVTAGPLLPGYPVPDGTTVAVSAGVHVPAALYLQPFPALVHDLSTVDDSVGGNGNSYPEPGESGILLYEQISNTGATTATDIGAYLTSLTPGVLVTVADSTYPDLARGAVAINNTPFVFSIAPTVPCGTRLDFQELLVTAQGSFTVSFSLYAKVPLPRASFFADDMESGVDGWVTGGTQNRWYQQTAVSHSPTHAWSDSPGSYANDANSWLRSPLLDTSGVVELQLSFWHRYDTEAGYDYAYVEYSTDGGTTWLPSVASYDGQQTTFVQETLAAAVLDDHASIAFRFRLQSDGGVTADGWYIDDVDLSYEPFACYYLLPAVPTLISPPDGTVTANHAITFTWEPGTGGGALDGYNLELDGSAIYTTTDPLLGLSLTAGLHTWRVRAYHSTGASDYTGSWTVEVQDLPAIPELLDPPDGSLVTTTHDVTLTWQAGAGYAPGSYGLELDGMVYNVTATTYPATLAAGDHTWRARACNTAGCSGYTTAWALTIVDAPVTPTLVYPPDGALITTTHDIAFAWQAGAGYAPDSYDLELDGMVYNVTATTYPATLAAGDHTWRARACNAAGCSGYTTAWALTILDAPVTPTLVYPPDGALITTTHDIAFAWQAGAGSPADLYLLEVNGTVYTTTGTVYTHTVPAGPFSWRVQAVNAAGGSGYSDPWNGEIVDPAGMPALLTPANGTVTTTAALAFTWQAGAGGAPDGYNLELDGTVITTTGPMYTATLTLGAHTWRVRAYNAAGYTAYTAAWTVTVKVVTYRVFLPLVVREGGGSDRGIGGRR